MESNAGGLASRRSKSLKELKEVKSKAISVVEDSHAERLESRLEALVEKE